MKNLPDCQKELIEFLGEHVPAKYFTKVIKLVAEIVLWKEAELEIEQESNEK